MQYVVTAAEMRAIDAATIEEIGLPGAVLMENAGRAVADAVMEERAGRPGPVAVVCGAGNNGGDGTVVARVLRARGVEVAMYLAAERGAVRGDAATHLGAYEQAGGVALSIATADELAAQAPAIQSAAVVVDALFGTGLAREVTGPMAEVVAVMNGAAGRVVAVDVPSGLSADRGVELGCAVRADRTVTMAFLKVALAVAPGLARAGRVTVAEIGIPTELAAAHGVRLARLERGDVAGLLPAAGATDHKNRRGHVLVVAGSPGKRGAGRLAALGAMRGGAGLVTLAAEVRDEGAAAPVMTAVIDADAAGAADALVTLAKGMRCVAIGPGMATGAGGRALVRAAVERLEVPIVLDADGLNHVADDPSVLARARGGVVLTPHPGEAARLLGCSVAEVEADRVAAVRALAEKTAAVVLLKGAGTLVCDGGEEDGSGFVTVNATGNAVLATAGAGDVLTGLIAALVGQGVGLADAARLGAWVHGTAGDVLRERMGRVGVTAL
ncbi:MAG TPA: NAD(P)H-hydrate dehydratase, partial [Kofleriaceae bacterium]|nr:NAD(P)H-hydrate dehydratase [Kofleriaceae bacterium]